MRRSAGTVEKEISGLGRLRVDRFGEGTAMALPFTDARCPWQHSTHLQSFHPNPANVAFWRVRTALIAYTVSEFRPFSLSSM